MPKRPEEWPSPKEGILSQKSPFDDFPEARPGLSLAAISVLSERQRQIEAEGWTPEHDDKHDKGQLAEAASCYADASVYAGLYGEAPPNPSDDWPWDWDCWKPTDRRRMLVKAGALILAEIERLSRRPFGLEPKPQPQPQPQPQPSARRLLRRGFERVKVKREG